eukprot:TRINITY_DN21200_c0_g1_i3.p1 TRINITY_DN21200_c0_g1~~TRINITY_DN21200_c0_g1_i3.p1  ORF type:complete len:944 (+),score=164.62 TRINITY_DN21200_c0_g1_i3:98-2833(+)
MWSPKYNTVWSPGRPSLPPSEEHCALWGAPPDTARRQAPLQLRFWSPRRPSLPPSEEHCALWGAPPDTARRTVNPVLSPRDRCSPPRSGPRAATPSAAVATAPLDTDESVAVPAAASPARSCEPPSSPRPASPSDPGGSARATSASSHSGRGRGCHPWGRNQAGPRGEPGPDADAAGPEQEEAPASGGAEVLSELREDARRRAAEAELQAAPEGAEGEEGADGADTEEEGYDAEMSLPQQDLSDPGSAGASSASLNTVPESPISEESGSPTQGAAAAAAASGSALLQQARKALVATEAHYARCLGAKSRDCRPVQEAAVRCVAAALLRMDAKADAEQLAAGSAEAVGLPAARCPITAAVYVWLRACGGGQPCSGSGALWDAMRIVWGEGRGGEPLPPGSGGKKPSGTPGIHTLLSAVDEAAGGGAALQSALRDRCAAAPEPLPALLGHGQLSAFWAAEQCGSEPPDFEDFRAVGLLSSDGRQDGVSHYCLAQFLADPVLNPALCPRRTGRECHDMSHPLPHYLVSSSHNTYLTGHQLHGLSSAEMYRTCFELGVKCVEIDAWDGPDGSPVVYHGFTPTSKISLESVATAIAAHGFTRSDAPVVISLEDHTGKAQNRKMHEAFVTALGGRLVTAAEVQGGIDLSPGALRGRVLIKADEKDPAKFATQAITALVIRPVKDLAKPVPPAEPHHVLNASENAVGRLQKAGRSALMLTNSMMVRIYPAGTRVNSDNLDPSVFWALGCHLVSLNWQTRCSSVRSTLGRFADNGGCGWLLKPPYLLDSRPPDDAGSLRIRLARAIGLELPAEGHKLLVTAKVVGRPEDAGSAGGISFPPRRSHGGAAAWSAAEADGTVAYASRAMSLLILRVFMHRKMLGEAVLPLSALRQGWRAVPLARPEDQKVLSGAALLCRFSW